MPTPKSPLDKPSHSRRPSLTRRTSSEKSVKSTKHGKSSHSSKTKDSTSDAMSGAKAPLKQGVTSRAEDESAHRSTMQDSVGRSLNDVQGTDEPGLVQREQVAGKGVVIRDSAEELERLRAAMNARLLDQHRDKLARQMSAPRKEVDSPTTTTSTGRKATVSPINEETVSPAPSFDGAFSSPNSPLDTASTESAKTIRGGMTPAGNVPRTPSYPFPSMRPPRQSSWMGHRPFTALSPTVAPSNYQIKNFDLTPTDHVLSGSATPGSTLNFHPPGGSEAPEDPNFQTPNLYELSLQLAAEPGLDAWWTTVVQVLRDCYRAERVALAVPADSTDIENVPWGQKASYNALREDDLSLVYLQRGSSLVPSSSGTNETSNSGDPNSDEFLPSFPSPGIGRPGLMSRHSYTAYEDTKRELTPAPGSARAVVSRPSPVARAKSYLAPGPQAPPRTGTLQNAQLNLQALEEHIALEESKPYSTEWEDTQEPSSQVQGRVFPVLQALDYEPDPLIDSGGVTRVLQRGTVVALTRDYPYVEEATDESSGGSKKSAIGTKNDVQEKSKSLRAPNAPGSAKRPRRGTRNFQSEKGKSLPVSASLRSDDDELRPPTPRYEEYEQAPPSPWAQSPAPSPAVRQETAENPFFSGLQIDEETFNAATSPQDYSHTQQVEAIGIDRSWTVLHVPLIHPLLSKSVQSFRLDAAAMELRSAARGKRQDTAENKIAAENAAIADKLAKEKKTPIAILSILTPVIPYPANLRHSLMHLAPHLATSFSLCRHYSNLETEIAGLSRKRPAIVGFGAVVPTQAGGEGNAADSTYSPNDENGPQRSIGGSITSPSDYSGISRSTVGSPAHTPGWDPGSIGFSREKRPEIGTPSHNLTGESYFTTKTRPAFGRVDTAASSGSSGARKASKDSSPSDSRFIQVSRTSESASTLKTGAVELDDSFETPLRSTNSRKQESGGSGDSLYKEKLTTAAELRDVSPSRKSLDTTTLRRQAVRTASGGATSKPEKEHTQLHSYGADFGSTFQSLPTTTTATKMPPDVAPPSRSGSISVATDAPQHMLPPSDRVKSLMLDSLPAHVFVALAVTGEIVWVNNRYLNYRGQTVPELYANPWGTIHPDDREEYLKSWSHAVRTGEQFSKQVRIRRFDGNYRWFYTRAVGHRDVRGVIKQWYGSHMDIHDQHIAEVKAARQEEIEASEAKHRQLANLIPQIIFAATEDEGVTFANEQWLSYTGQSFEDALGVGFMDFVHPEDLAKCSITSEPTITSPLRAKKPEVSRNYSQTSSGANSSNKSSNISDAPSEATAKDVHPISRNNSSGSSSFADFPIADLSQLARSGIIKASTDSNGRLSYTTEVRLRSKSGEYRWHLVRCVEVDNISLGKGDGSWFGACTDINDHKLLETKLKEAMDSKTRFLSNMSHEIRTPLIGISGMVNFLQDTTLNDEQMDYANTIHASAKSLLNIINDILDLSKVDAGMMKLSYDWFHPRSLVEEVNEMVCTMAITKRLELNYIVENDVPEMVKGDKFRIRQVLLNVVGNAIKFTSIGEVFSRCRVITNSPGLDENEIMLEFSVIDTGRGFTKAEAELIFKPFSQIDGSSTRQHGGSGLGLVISRTLVELHGGKMEGSAVPDKGSTFVFTAKFGLPTLDDHPEAPMTPQLTPALVSRTASTEGSVTSQQPLQKSGLGGKVIQPLVDSPIMESNPTSPAVVSSGGSTPSTRSIHSHATQRSSGSSVPPNFSHFGEAARSGSQDLNSMKFAIPTRLASPSMNAPTIDSAANFNSLITQDSNLFKPVSGTITPVKGPRPPMYSILLVCPQMHSREATTQHIENTLPKDVPHQITALASVTEAQDMITGEDPINFTHIVLNLGSAEEIVSVIGQIKGSNRKPLPSIVILSDPVERQEVTKLGASYEYDQLAKENSITFIYKPVKPSRFAVVFDPDKERDLSTDRNRFSAQQQVASQKQNYLDVAKRLGNKGFRVLLVEDNLVNQKVLLKYLSKIGIVVELALDGVECIDKVFAKGHDFYSLILCDLHMPRKDGYQTCREIRQWEKKERYTRMPIIALSANVMADVLEKCVQAGFSNYVTKPVDFKALSSAMGDLLDPINSGASPSLLA